MFREISFIHRDFRNSDPAIVNPRRLVSQTKGMGRFARRILEEPGRSDVARAPVVAPSRRQSVALPSNSGTVSSRREPFSSQTAKRAGYMEAPAYSPFLFRM